MDIDQAPIRIGVQLTPQHATYAQLRDAAARVEDSGADLLFNWDHFFPLSGDREGQHFECWTMLAAWAEQTERIELGPLVSAIGYRNPDLLADMARTVDHISDGRLVLGVGAGFKEREYVEYGYPFPSPRQRVDDLEAGLTRIRARLERLTPAPRRRIPILVAAGGRRSLQVVARHADIWSTFADDEVFAEQAATLDGYCVQNGRQPGGIERSVLVGPDPAVLGPRLLAMGVRLFIVLVTEPYDLAGVRAWLTWRRQQCGHSAG